MSYELKSNYLDPDNFEFDADLIEVVTGTRLKPIPAVGEAYAYWKLDPDGIVARDDTDNERDGSLENTWDENSWVSTGKFGNGIEGNNAGFIKFPPHGVFERTDSFSIAMWFSYTNSGTELILSKQIDSGAFQGYIVNKVAGKLRFVIRDINGNRNTVETASAYTGAGLHLLVATYDGLSDVNGMKIFIDNVDVSVVIDNNPMDSTIECAADLQISGRDGANSPMLVGTVVSDVQMYERELSPAEIAFLWNNGAGTQIIPGPGISYSTVNPTIQPKLDFDATEIVDFLATINSAGSDEVKFVMVVNGLLQYFTTEWILSDGTYSQTNTFAEVAANIGTLISERSKINFIAFLHSEDGTTTPELIESTISFNNVFPVDPEVPHKTTVFGVAYKPNGVISTDTFRIILNKDGNEYGSINQVRKITIGVQPNSAGEWSQDLIDTDSMETGSYYEWKWRDRSVKKLVPKVSSVSYNDLTLQA